MKEFEDILEEINHNLEWCDDAYQSRCYRRSHDEITRLRAENESLREALRPLAKITLWTDKYPDGPLSVDGNMRFIDPQWIVRARASLGGTPK